MLKVTVVLDTLYFRDFETKFDVFSQHNRMQTFHAITETKFDGFSQHNRMQTFHAITETSPYKSDPRFPPNI